MPILEPVLNIMANKVIGRFYFKKSSNGNLIGEFSNNKSSKISTESSNLAKGCSANYAGEYHSTWQENRRCLFADLDISENPSSEGKLFTLNWCRDGKPIFEGGGMLCEGILIGDYHDV
jgi:hypothetical protein